MALEREFRESRQAYWILRKASAYFTLSPTLPAESSMPACARRSV